MLAKTEENLAIILQSAARYLPPNCKVSIPTILVISLQLRNPIRNPPVLHTIFAVVTHYTQPQMNKSTRISVRKFYDANFQPKLIAAVVKKDTSFPLSQNTRGIYYLHIILPSALRSLFPNLFDRNFTVVVCLKIPSF